MCASYEYFGLVNPSYFKGNDWKTEMVTEINKKNAEIKISTLYLVHKFDVSLRTKSEEKIHLDDISLFVVQIRWQL